jgi:hypothetical protein
MKAFRTVSLVFAIVVGISLQNSARGEGGGFHFPVGLTYSKGAQDTMNKLLDCYEWEWEDEYSTDIDMTRVVIPIGLTFSPYYEWNVAPEIGVGVGLSMGPTTVVIASLEEGYGSGDSVDTKASCIIPVGMDARCTFFNKKDVSPYVRLGFRYPLAFGDNIDSSEPGVFVAAGVEFWRTKRIGMSVEVGYDDSVVTLEAFDGGYKKDMTFAGFTAGVSVVF